MTDWFQSSDVTGPSDFPISTDLDPFAAPDAPDTTSPSYAPITTIDLDSTFTTAVHTTNSTSTFTTSTTRTPTHTTTVILTPTTSQATTSALPASPAVTTFPSPIVSPTAQGNFVTPPPKSKGSLAGIIGTVLVGVLVIIVAVSYLCRQKRRRKLVRDALAYDPTSVDRIYQEEKLRERDEKRNSWYDDLDLTLDGYSRYPSVLLDQPELPLSPLPPRSLTSLSMPAPALLPSGFR